MFRSPHCFSLLLLSFIATCAQAQQPNIVFIISDDAGYADWGFMDSYTQSVNPGQATSPVPTPNLDRLRDRGVLFTDAYTAAVCSPSRAAIITGSYQQRIGYEYNIKNLTDPTTNFEGLRSEDITIFERMGARGYTTGAIGKWHVGGIPDIVEGGVITKPGNRPPRQGVDEFFGILRGSRNYSVGPTAGDETRALREMSLDANGLEINTDIEAMHSGEYVTNTFGQGAVDFIDRHYADDDPFFLYVSFTAPHGPIGPSPDRNEPGISSDYGSMVFTMDKEIGRIMDKVSDPAGDGSVDLTAETLFIFINDNGGASGIGTRNMPLRNWKGSVYEGGIRVPMIFAGAGVTATPGAVYSEPVHSIDILATCHELAGGATLTEIDGVNLLPFINGAGAGAPHDAIVVRSEAKYGIRMGDWKLTRNSRGATPQLFDLSAAIDEADASDVAATNPDTVSQMQQILTEHEVGFDKPRFPGLNGSQDSINRNDHFILAPVPPVGGTFTADQVLVSPTVLNGGFEDPAIGGGVDADRNSFAEADFWINIGTGAQTDVLARSNLTRSSPQNAVISDGSGRVPALDTGHTITAGESFRVRYWWRDASNWNDASDQVGFTFYTTSNNAIDGVVTSSQQFLSGTSSANSTYQQAEAIFTPEAGDSGKRLFVSFVGVDGNGNTGGFVRVDDITIERGTLSNDGGGDAELRWSDASVWTDADTGQGDTLLDLDSFPGAVLEFPVSNGFSYTVSNDMTRPTGLEFMLNKILLSGTATEAGSATIDGNTLLFTPSLEDAPATIENNAVGADFSFLIETPIMPWRGLVISGDGTAVLKVSGSISDHDVAHPGSLTKRGDSALTISGQHSYTGNTTVEAGMLELDTAALDGTDLVEVANGATLTGNGSIAGNLNIAGDLRIDLDAVDRIDVAGIMDLAGASLTLSGTPQAGSQAIASYTALNGSFSSISGLPAGYELDLTHSGGTQIALVQTGNPYTNWAENTSGLSGADAAFDADPNQDGVPNGIAFFLGAPDAQANARDLLPSVTTSANSALFVFSRAAAASGHSFAIRYSSDLDAWTTAIDEADGVSIVIDNGEITGTFPTSLANGERLYLQLSVSE